MKSFFAVLSIAIELAGCATREEITAAHTNVQFADERLIRARAAELLVGTIQFGGLPIFRQRLINAVISRFEPRIEPFSKTPFLSACAAANIENPLFPLHKSASAAIMAFPIENGQTRLRFRASSDTWCPGSNLAPFPELEEARARQMR